MDGWDSNISWGTWAIYFPEDIGVNLSVRNIFSPGNRKDSLLFPQFRRNLPEKWMPVVSVSTPSCG